MERNTIVAFLLCALIFIGYESIFPPPKPALVPQTLHNTTVTTQLSNTSTPMPLSNQSGLPAFKPALFQMNSNPVQLSFSNEGGSLQNINFIKNPFFPITNVLNIEGYQNVRFQAEEANNQHLLMRYEDKNLKISKEFEYSDKNLLKVRMEIINVSKTSILENLKITAFDIDNSNNGELARNSRDAALYEYSILSNKIIRKGNATKFNDKNNKEEIAKVKWLGFRDHYHAYLIAPEFETKAYSIKTLADNQLNVSILPTDKTLAPGESVVYTFTIYAGPQNPWRMKEYGKGFEKIVAFSNFSLIEWISQAIYHAIPFIHRFFGSWGVSIILISLVIYGITYPLTWQSMVSMRKMQEVQPKINALRDRFKNDPQKLNVEMMEIYRREKINPLGGCLPFLIQMPFFMALYQILWRAQYFQGQGFLWIRDLSQPDKLLTLPYYLPFFGNELNILPILTGIIMFVQQKISTKNMIVVDEQQASQQKMMMYILPVMMTCMFYKFASSWAIYFFVFYVLSTLSQWKIAQLSKKNV